MTTTQSSGGGERLYHDGAWDMGTLEVCLAVM